MDRRDCHQQWYDRFDERQMVLVVTDDEGEELELPARYDVCDTCHGTGSHVNPSIDSHGLSRDDFDEDPDFAEDYFRGVYDVSCHECHGRRVVPVVDEYRATEAELALVESGSPSSRSTTPRSTRNGGWAHEPRPAPRHLSRARVSDLSPQSPRVGGAENSHGQPKSQLHACR